MSTTASRFIILTCWKFPIKDAPRAPRWRVFSRLSGITALALQSVVVPANAQHPVFTEADLDAVRKPAYTLERVEGCRMLSLEGPLQVGITSALKSSLEKRPDVRALLLESNGGNVYQARGLASIVRKHALDTYVLEKCHSACTIVFLAGSNRYVSPNAKVGFHGYRMHDGRRHPAIDITREENKDHAVIASRIPDKRFVERLSRHSSRRLWIPSVSRMVGAGVAHGVIGHVQEPGGSADAATGAGRLAQCGTDGRLVRVQPMLE